MAFSWRLLRRYSRSRVLHHTYISRKKPLNFREAEYISAILSLRENLLMKQLDESMVRNLAEQDGMSVYSMSKKMNVRPFTMETYLKCKGIKITKPSYRSQSAMKRGTVNPQRLKRMMDQGMSALDIANSSGIHVKSVKAQIKKITNMLPAERIAIHNLIN